MKKLVLALLLTSGVVRAESALGDITVTDEFQNAVVDTLKSTKGTYLPSGLTDQDIEDLFNEPGN